MFDASFWGKILGVLLNAPESLPLADFLQPLDARLAEAEEKVVKKLHLTFMCVDTYVHQNGR